MKNKNIKTTWGLGKINDNVSIMPRSKINSSPFFQFSTKKIKKSNMGWTQSKIKYPNLMPFADADRDGVPNVLDCRPFNRKKHGPSLAGLKAAVSSVASNVTSAATSAYRAADKAVGGYLPGGVPVKKTTTTTAVKATPTYKVAGTEKTLPIPSRKISVAQLVLEKTGIIKPTPSTIVTPTPSRPTGRPIEAIEVKPSVKGITRPTPAPSPPIRGIAPHTLPALKPTPMPMPNRLPPVQPRPGIIPIPIRPPKMTPVPIPVRPSAPKMVPLSGRTSLSTEESESKKKQYPINF